ncbi:MAG: TIGR00295 family protein [Candidatus Altiarchaeota archaeon]
MRSSRTVRGKSKKTKPSEKKKLSPEEALRLLAESGCSKRVIEHCKAVSKQAVGIARKIGKKGYKVDLEFIQAASLLHDIGRSRTHGIRHGIEGARIMKNHPKYARVCERHIGAGIGKKESKKLGLPAKSYIPRTLEEKIIAHTDNTIEGRKVVPIERTIKAYEEKLGKTHPATKMVIRLSDYIEKLMETDSPQSNL